MEAHTKLGTQLRECIERLYVRLTSLTFFYYCKVRSNGHRLGEAFSCSWETFNICVHQLQVSWPQVSFDVFAHRNVFRLTAYGFLGGTQIFQEGNGNLGLRDREFFFVNFYTLCNLIYWSMFQERLALKWINKYIRAFGGDASKVTMLVLYFTLFMIDIHLTDVILLTDGDNLRVQFPLAYK